MISSISLALTFAPVQSTQVNLADDLAVSAVWHAGSFPGSSGKVELIVKDGTKFRREKIDLPRDSWPEQDAPQRPTASLSRSVNKEEAILDLTLAIESGVYGYRRVRSYRVTPRKARLLTRVGEPIEISDLGSWRRISERKIEFWDAILKNDEAHHAPHYYRLTQLLQSPSKNSITCVVKTKKRYAFNWFSESSAKATRVPADKDPLRELGTAWTWWGEPRRAEK